MNIKKTIISFLLALFLINSTPLLSLKTLASNELDSWDEDTQKVRYTLNAENSTASVKYLSSETIESVVIPEQVVKDGKKYTVTSVENNAFDYRINLSSIVLPETVTEIGTSAFSGCSSLKNINIPDGVTIIEFSLFFGCENLREITLPESIKTISSSAFYECSRLKNIKLPGKVETIEDSAFYGCEELTSAIIPESVVSIAKSAFSFCFKLNLLKLSENLKSIGTEAFLNCYNLTEITIPASVTEIGENAFGLCTKIANYIVAGGNTCFASDANGILYTKDMTEIIYYPAGNTRTEFLIPKNVTKIWSTAFTTCLYLTKIDVEDGNPNYSGQDGVLFNKAKTELIQYPFGNTNNQYTVPGSVTRIQSKAFYFSYYLTDIIVPDNVSEIGSFAFYGTPWYKNQPEGLLYIGKVAYEYLGSAALETSITFKEGTKGIADNAFYHFYNLTEVSIPKSVIYIGAHAFEECKLQVIKVDSENKYFSTDENGVLFNKDKTRLIKFTSSSDLVSYTVPDGVEEICDSAFNGYHIAVTLPNGLKKIGSYQYFGGSNQELKIPYSVQSLGNFAVSCGTLYISAATDTLDKNSIYASVVFGRKGSAAEKYCNEHEYPFYDYIERMNTTIEKLDLVNPSQLFKKTVLELKGNYEWLSDEEKKEIKDTEKLFKAIDLYNRMYDYPKFKDSFLNETLDINAMYGILPRKVKGEVSSFDLSEDELKSTRKNCGDKTVFVSGFDLSYKKEDGTSVSPDTSFGSVTATLKINEAYLSSTALVVVYIDGEGKITELATEIKNGYASFPVNNAGKYALVEKAGKIPDYKMYVIIGAIIALFFIILTIILIVLKKKNNKSSVPEEITIQSDSSPDMVNETTQN